jgi:GDPmannose 4,6-dehydratase
VNTFIIDITDITGQGGAYLAELLMANGYMVYDALCRTSTIKWPVYAGMERCPTPQPARTVGTWFGLCVSRSVPKIRFLQAGASEMLGMVQAIPQGESALFYLRIPHGVANLSRRDDFELRRDQVSGIVAFPLPGMTGLERQQL